MSEFEFSSLSSDSDDEMIKLSKKTNKNSNIFKVKRELHLYYSNLFIDSFNLIDLFVKSKILTYESFLGYFDSTKFHQIYAKRKPHIKQLYVSPHHYIMTTQDVFAVSTKFLRSKSREARIGAIYLLYTLYQTQPLKSYKINIKMEPIDYNKTKQLVEECFNQGLLHPAYCFYDLDIKKRITITATTINPCLEANYPRLEVRKHMGRVAEEYFKIEYEERSDIDPINKLQLMEQQMHQELSYINKLSNLTLGRDVASENNTELSKVFEQITAVKQLDTNKPQSDILKRRYTSKKNIVFPGRNDNILEDMVTTMKSPEKLPPSRCDSKKKKKRRKIGSNKNTIPKKISTMKDEPCTSSSLPKLSVVLDSDSSQDSSESDDFENSDDVYGDMIWNMIEGKNSKNGLFDDPPDTDHVSDSYMVE